MQWVDVWVHCNCIGRENLCIGRDAAKLFDLVYYIVGVLDVAQDDGGEDLELAVKVG